MLFQPIIVRVISELNYNKTIKLHLRLLIMMVWLFSGSSDVDNLFFLFSGQNVLS